MKNVFLLTFYIIAFTKGYSQLSANSYFKDGFSLYQSGNYEQAINSFNLAIGLEPERNYFYYHRGNANKMLGNKAEAIADYNKCNELKPTAEAYYTLGTIYIEQKDSTSAFSNFIKANEIRPDIEKLNFYMALYHYKKGEDTAALTFIDKYITKYINKVDGFILKHLICLHLKNYKDAIQSLDQALTRDYNDWKIYYHYYLVYKEMNNYENAIYNLTMVIEMGHKKSVYYQERAKLYSMIGNTDKANEDNIYALDTSKAK